MKPQIVRFPGVKLSDSPGSFYWQGSSERDFEMSSDGYKYAHWMFQDLGVTENYDYLTSRGGMFDKLVMFGAQAQFMKHLVGCRVTPESVKRTAKKVARY